MSLSLKLNIKKGWPSPTIVEKVAKAASTVSTLEAGKVGTLNASGEWILGITTVNQTPYVFRNDQDSPDAGRAAHEDYSYAQAQLGGVQGISHANPLEYETVQWSATAVAIGEAAAVDTGAPAVGDQLYADSDGKLKVAVTAGAVVKVDNAVIVAIVTEAAHTYQGLSYITVTPDNSKRLA